MNIVNGLITNNVVSSRHQQDNVVYYDLGQVKVGISSSHLLWTILESVIVVDTTRIKEGLRNTKLCHSIGSGLLQLFTKSNQLRCQIGLCFFHFLKLMGLLRKRLSLGRQLLVKGTNNLQVLSTLFVFNLQALTKPSNHPLTSHTPILKGLHTHQRLKQNVMVKIKSKNIIEVQYKWRGHTLDRS